MNEDRGDGRKLHYGEGVQPWDVIVEADWAPEFAAGNVLKYLRRTKDPEHSLASARVYWGWLHALSRGQLLPRFAREGDPLYRRKGRTMAVGRANAVLVGLLENLTIDERERLGPVA